MPDTLHHMQKIKPVSIFLHMTRMPVKIANGVQYTMETLVPFFTQDAQRQVFRPLETIVLFHFHCSPITWAVDVNSAFRAQNAQGRSSGCVLRAMTSKSEIYLPRSWDSFTNPDGLDFLNESCIFPPERGKSARCAVDPDSSPGIASLVRLVQNGTRMRREFRLFCRMHVQRAKGIAVFGTVAMQGRSMDQMRRTNRKQTAQPIPEQPKCWTQACTNVLFCTDLRARRNVKYSARMFLGVTPRDHTDI